MGTTSAWETNASSSTKKSIDVIFEKTSGHILYAWGAGSDMKFRTYANNILSSASSLSNPQGSG
jgi:hypothetical protein